MPSGQSIMRGFMWVGVGGATGGLLLAGLAGCVSPEQRSKASQSDSILALMPTPPTPAEAAAWAADPYDPDKRFRGTVLLSNAPWGGESVYLQLYRAQLGAVPNSEPDADPSVRAAAAFALGLHGAPEDAPTVAKLLTDNDRLVRVTAVRALQRLHNTAVIPGLVARTYPGPPRGGPVDPNDPRQPEIDPDIRAEAADALGQYPDDRVYQALVASLSDERFAVTTAARKSLKTLTGQDFGDDKRAWLDWGKRTDRFAAQSTYVYPTFSREKGWLEHLPFFPQPARNEVPGSPVGLTAAETPSSTPADAAGAQDRPIEAPVK